jgi:hypothetical protein
MNLGYLQRKFHNLVTWWHAPITRKDRILGAVVGSFGGFWIGVLGSLLLGPMPVSFITIGWWALYSIIAGALLGIAFPKVILCVCYPFSTFGGGVGT